MWAAPGALAAFILVEFYKAAVEWLPVDAVIITGGFAAIVAAWRLFQDPYFPPQSAPVLLWIALLIIPAVTVGVPNEYGLLKLTRVLTFVTLAAAVTPILLKSEDDARRFLTAAQGIGVAMLVVAAADLTGMLLNPYGRLEAGGVSTIYLGRGFALVALLTVARLATDRQHISRAASLALATLFILAMFATGNRQGPLAFTVGVVALVLIIPGVRPWFRTLAIASAATVPLLFTAFLDWLPGGAALRYRSFLEEGLQTESGSVRLDLLQIVLDTPTAIGHGWGSFATLQLAPHGVPILYPHNIIAEVAYEGGYILAILAIAVLSLALIRAWRASTTIRGLVVTLTLTASLVGAMISSDLNDTRLLFAMTSVALTLRPPRRITKRVTRAAPARTQHQA